MVPPATLKWLDPIKPELPLFPRQPLYRAKQEFEFVLIITEAQKLAHAFFDPQIKEELELQSLSFCFRLDLFSLQLDLF